MKSNLFISILKSFLAIGAILACSTVSTHAANTSQIKKEAHAKVSNKTYRYGSTYFYFASNGSVYYGKKNGKIKRNYWGVRYTRATKKLKVCFVVNTVTAAADIRASYCDTPAKLLRAKVGNGDVHNLSRRSKFR